MSNTRKRGRRKPQRKINQKMKEKLVILFGLVLLALVVLILRITFINATRLSRNMKVRYCRQKEAIFMIKTEISWPPAIKFIM